MVEQFFIINKAGGMIYKYTKSTENKINSLIILASTIHSLNELTRNIFDIYDFSQVIEMKNINIYIYRTLTNTMFVFSVSKEYKTPVFEIFKNVYKHYCDSVLINPFYQLEMPINCKKFNPEKYFVNKKN